MKLFSKPMNELTKEERDYVRNQLNELDMDDIKEKLTDITNEQERINTRINGFEDTQKIQGADIDQLKKDTNVLCAPTHHKKRSKFKKKASARVRFLLGNDKTTPEYMLFSPYFFKGIYADVAYQLELGEWDDISMEGYEELNSQYERAKEIRDNWKPSYIYFKRCLDELIEKRDKGELRQERCRALTAFLSATDNGKNVAFL